MALTNQQVQQAYLSILGRPAEGDAVLWGSLATDVPGLINTIITIRNGVDFNKDNTIFVQNLYENLLGRTGDDEGLSFWVAALNAGMNYGELVTSFISSAAQTLSDLYTIQNKLALAEQISTQIKTIKGGAPAEAKLKALMSTIDDQTSINDIQEDINHFIGQFNEAKKVTVKPGADEPTIGSDEHASTYNATVNLNDENTNLNIEGSTSFDDTLNLTVKGSSSNNTFNSSDIGQLSNLNTINLNLRDSRLTNSNITTSDLGAQNLKIKGTSADNITVNSQMSLLDTGDGGDTLSVNQSVESIKTGKGNDKVTINAKVGTLDTSAGDDNIKVNAQVNSIDAGSGNDIIDLAANSKINKLNAGAGDDIISISQKANIKNALIDGGAGFNSLKLYDGLVDLTQTTLSGINALSGEARLKLSQIGAQNFILGVERLDDFAEPTGIFDSAKLEIKAEQGSMDLSKLAIAEDSTGHELKILDVKNSTIKLNDNNLGNSDDSDSTKVSVYGTNANDTITIESGKVSLLDSLSGNDTITISQAASVAILNANDGKNTIKIAGKVGTLTTKSGDDNISVSGEVKTINTNDGNDIVDISGQVTSLNTGAGDDNISVSGALKELNAGAGDDNININQGSKINSLNAGDGNDIISIQKGADINNAKIDGGSGFNSLKLLNGEVDLSRTSLNNISAISGEAKLKANQINNKPLTLGTEQKDNYGDLSGVFDSATLNIQADKADLNLNNLKIASGSKNHTINIQNAKESQISLNDKNLGNDGIDDVEVFASKVNVAGTANKDKITLKEGKFASLDANNGNDIINIEKGASLASLKAGDGNDTINIKGKVSELDAGNGDDDVIVEKDAEVKKLNAGAGDDIIRVKNGAKIDLIDGNAGSDTLAFDKSSDSTSQTPTDISKTTISNIEILDGFGLLSAKQINGQSFILGGDKNKEVDGQKLSGNAKLQVKSDDLTNINLNNLKSQTGVKDNTVEVQDVSEGKITLSDAKQYIKETIKLTANAHSVDISNIKGGDKIDFTNIQSLNGSTGTSAADSPVSLGDTNTTISGSKLYTINLVNGSLDDLSSLDSTLSTYSVSSNANALLAINQNGKAHIFKVNGPSTKSPLNSNMLKLLAITDSEINLGTTKVIGNTIELNGSVTITINKGDKIVQSAGNADTVFVGSVDISQADQGTPNNQTQIIGSKDFTDTLAIQITSGASTGGTGTNKLDKTAFDKIVDTNKVKDVENLTLSTGNVEVDLTLENTNGNFQNEVTIAGSGTTKLQVKQDTQKISLGSGSGDVTVSSASVGDLNLGGGQNTLKVESGGKIGEVTGSDSKDTITISGSGSVDKITTNGGADEIKLENAGTLKTLEASSGSDTVTISGSGSISNITGEGKVKIGDNTEIQNTLDIGSYKAELTISGSSANVKNLLADNNKIKLEANSQIEKLQIKDGGNVSVSGSGSITFDTTNDTGTHTITIGDQTTLKTFTAGSGDDTITIANGGKLSGASIDFKNGDNILNVMSGGNIDELTTITTGNGNSDITINAGASATKLANINLGNGNNTLTLGVSGDTAGLTVSGGSGTDNITVMSGGKISTLNAGENTTNLDLQLATGVANINANSAGSEINITNHNQVGAITKITGNSGSDIINVGKNMTVSEIETGTGALSVNGEATITKLTVTGKASGDITIGTNTKTTVSEIVASGDGSKVTLKGNGKVNKLNLSGNTTEDITIGNGVTVKDFTTDNQGSDTITVASGGALNVIGNSLNFSGGTSNLTVNSGGDISTITKIEMGSGASTIDLQSGAKADKLTTIDLGEGTNTLKVGVSGDATSGLTVKGNSGTDTIEVGSGGKITTLDAGQNATNIKLSDGGTIDTINAENAQGSTIKVEGQGTIGTITGKDSADNITLGDGITLGTYTGGTGDDTLNLSGATVNTISAGKDNTTISGDSTNKGTVDELKTDASTDAHNITISNATVNKLTAGTGDDNITLGEGGALGNAQNTSIDFKEGANTLTINSGGDISALTRIDMGDNGNASVTINEGAKLGTTTIELGSTAGTTGTENKNTFTLKANGENLTVQGTSSDEEINVSGADAKLGTLNVGVGKTTINLASKATIDTINAEASQEIVTITGEGTISNINAGANGNKDSYVLSGADVKVENYNGNEGEDSINFTGATVTNLNTGKGKTTITGNSTNKGTIENLKTDGAAANETRTISVENTTINNLVAGNGDDIVTIGTGAVLKGDSDINFGDGSNTLTINANGKIEGATSLTMKGSTNHTNELNVSGDITSLENITVGGGEGSNNNAITLADSAKIGTNLNITLSASLGTTTTDLEHNTLTMNANSTIKKVTGSSIKDNIIVSGTSASIEELNAGAGETAINLSENATISTIIANEDDKFNLSVSGADITKNIITTISGSDTLDTVKITKAKVENFNAGKGQTSITLADTATITTLNAQSTEGGIIDISGAGTIDKIVGNAGADTIKLGKDITLTTYTGGTGDDTLELTGNTVTNVETGTGTTTISGDATQNGTITTLKTDSAKAGETRDITIENANVTTYTAGQGNDKITLKTGGVLGDGTNKTIDFNSGANELILNGGNISNLESIDMGDNGNANVVINSGQFNATKTDITLGTAAADGKNTFTMYASGDKINVSGSSSTDEITVSGGTAALGTITAGKNLTNIKLGAGGSISKIDASNVANTIDIEASGSLVGSTAGTITSITASGDQTHTINVGKSIVVNNYSATDNGVNNITVKTGGNIGDITTASGADTITLEAGASFMLNKTNQAPTINTGSGDDTITIEGTLDSTGSSVTIDFGDGTNDKLVLKNGAVISDKITAIKNVNTIDLTDSTATSIDFSKVSGSVTIDKVNADSTITLNNTVADNKTVKLEGKKATILNVTSGDKIDFTGIDGLNLSTAISTGSFTSANTTGSSISASGTYVWHEGMNDFSNAEQVKAKIKDAASNLTSGQKALVAINNGDTSNNKSAIYLVSGSGTNGNGENITLDLLGIVGHKIDNGDKLAANGVIEFA